MWHRHLCPPTRIPHHGIPCPHRANEGHRRSHDLDTVFLIRQFVLNCTPIHCRLMRLPHLPFPQSAPLGSCRWPAPRTARMRRIAKSDHRTTSFAGQTAQEVTRRPTDSIRRRHLASDIPSQRPDELRMRTMADETRSPMARLRRYAPNDRWSGRKYDGRKYRRRI